GTVRHRHLGAFDGHRVAAKRFGDVLRRHRAEQVALLARDLAREGDAAHGEIPARLRRGESVGGELRQFLATLLDLVSSLVRGRNRQPVRNQVVASVARLDLHEVAEVAEIVDAIEQYDFHGADLNAGRSTEAARGSAPASPRWKAGAGSAPGCRCCGWE